MILSLFNSYFNDFQLSIIVSSFALGVFSLYCFFFLKNFKLSIFILALAAIILRFGIIAFDPFLNLWDEQFHALVAKNMITNPFKPMLITQPLIDFSIEYWTGNHIWLHKPPLFLWQIALSMKIFGVNEIALRLPSAIMSLITVFFVFSVAKTLLNRYIAYFASLILVFSSFVVDLVSGYHHTDHNDIAFIFYVTASFWAWVNFATRKKENLNLVLIAVFSAAAVLTKWLPGFIIFGVWFIWVIVDKEQNRNIKSYLRFFYSFLISVILVLPWNLYAYLNFPAEYNLTFFKKAGHFLNVIEDHEGGIFYHWNILDEIYFKSAKILIILALFLLYKKIKIKRLKLPVLSFFLIGFVFYSIAATKMPAFTLISSLVVYLAFGTLMYESLLFFKIRNPKNLFFSKVLAFIFFVLIIFNSFNIENIQKLHTDWKTDYARDRFIKKNNAKTFKELENKFPANSIVINCRPYDAVQCMFYTSYNALDGYPSEEVFENLLKTNKLIIVLLSENLPDYIVESENVVFFKSNYW